MHDPAVKHTLAIFERTYNNLPPLVPDDVLNEIGRYLTSLRTDYDVTLVEVEDVMVGLGKQVWPYIQAFDDIYSVYEERLAEKLLEQKATHSVRKKYKIFREAGGSFKELYQGAIEGVFDNNEHIELSGLLVGLKSDVRKHALQAVMSQDRKSYDEKVEKYGEIVEEINNVIEDLHSYANEEEHEVFAQEVRDRARAIGHSLVFLGPRMDMEEIRGSREYYEGRKEERKFRR